MFMFKYVLKRVGMAILTIFITITLTFFLMKAIPGSPFAQEKKTSQEAMDNLNAKYGLDVPVLEQYGNYLKNISKGDFGEVRGGPLYRHYAPLYDAPCL
jgi:oligopeptide transport system permease protein